MRTQRPWLPRARCEHRPARPVRTRASLIRDPVTQQGTTHFFFSGQYVICPSPRLGAASALGRRSTTACMNADLLANPIFPSLLPAKRACPDVADAGVGRPNYGSVYADGALRSDPQGQPAAGLGPRCAARALQPTANAAACMPERACARSLGLPRPISVRVVFSISRGRLQIQRC